MKIIKLIYTYRIFRCYLNRFNSMIFIRCYYKGSFKEHWNIIFNSYTDLEKKVILSQEKISDRSGFWRITIKTMKTSFYLILRSCLIFLGFNVTESVYYQSSNLMVLKFCPFIILNFFQHITSLFVVEWMNEWMNWCNNFIKNWESKKGTKQEAKNFNIRKFFRQIKHQITSRFLKCPLHKPTECTDQSHWNLEIRKCWKLSTKDNKAFHSTWPMGDKSSCLK